MGHEGRKDAYVYAVESKVRKLWRNEVGMAEIWKATCAILVGFPCIHLRAMIQRYASAFGGFRKAGFHHRDRRVHVGPMQPYRHVYIV